MLQENHKYYPNFSSPLRPVHEIREQMKEEIKQEVREELRQELLGYQQREFRRQMNQWLQLIPSEVERKQEIIANIMAQKRVEAILEKEALHLWDQKPSNERMKRIGFFRWEEDRERRDKFIKQYTDKHFENRLKKELKVNILI